MPRKKKVIKRIYEKGEEITVSSRKKDLASPELIRRKLGLPPMVKRKGGYPGRVVEYSNAEEEGRLALEKARQTQARKDFLDSADIPSAYGTTRLTLMAKDPLSIYAYWELAEDFKQSVKDNLSEDDMKNAQIVLRMYNVSLIDFNGFNANGFFDIEVGLYATNWYVNLWSDNVAYVGEIGLKTGDGSFYPLARSNCVQTPRISYSPRTEHIWMRVDEKAGHRPYAVGSLESQERGDARAGKKMLSDMTALVRKKSAELPRRKHREVFYLNEDDIRRYYSGLNPLLKDIISAKLRSFQGERVSKYGLVALEGDTPEEREMIFKRLPGVKFMRRMRAGASEELVILGEAGSHVAGSAASDAARDKGRQRKFFFELNTELIVYGRTEPDAEVWMGNKRVPLRGDGTFSMRFALPDGKIPLEFRAVSGDKEETRKIYTYVERTTNTG
ncbi:MAG: DUF4912 domain-containing protein [Candidatus Omnitrophota bacterium]